MSHKYIVGFWVVWVTSVGAVCLTSPKKLHLPPRLRIAKQQLPPIPNRTISAILSTLFHLHHLTMRHPCRSWPTLSQNYSCDVPIMPIQRMGVSQPSSRPQNPT